jgi:hypothetical protein
MAVKLNQRGYDYAQRLVEDDRVVLDERDDWSEHQPSTHEKNQFIKEHGWGEYGRWHLGVDDDEPEDRKSRYKFPYGGLPGGAPVRGAVGRVTSRPAQVR